MLKKDLSVSKERLPKAAEINPITPMNSKKSAAKWTDKALTYSIAVSLHSLLPDGLLLLTEVGDYNTEAAVELTAGARIERLRPSPLAR
jgi:hypothetical protein